MKIGDFGISRFLNGSLQQAQTTVGTPYYLSPEICQQRLYPLVLVNQKFVTNLKNIICQHEISACGKFVNFKSN